MVSTTEKGFLRVKSGPGFAVVKSFFSMLSIRWRRRLHRHKCCVLISQRCVQHRVIPILSHSWAGILDSPSWILLLVCPIGVLLVFIIIKRNHVKPHGDVPAVSNNDLKSRSTILFNFFVGRETSAHLQWSLGRRWVHPGHPGNPKDN